MSNEAKEREWQRPTPATMLLLRARRYADILHGEGYENIRFIQDLERQIVYVTGVNRWTKREKIVDLGPPPWE